jgi:IclR family transcriptional regulator, acetate operon repressor
VSAAGTRIRSVSRAARILDFLARQGEGRSATETAAALEIAVPTVYHLLNTLAAEGLVAKDSRRRYHLGPQIGLLSDAFRNELSPPEYLLARLHQLSESTGETVYLSAWRNGEVVVLACIEGNKPVRVHGPHIGMSGVAHARASGKLLLAFASPAEREAYLRNHPLERLTARTVVDPEKLAADLALAARRGYALDLEEFREDVRCVAAPILQGEEAIAAYTIAAPANRFRVRRAVLVDAVRAAAASVSISAPRAASGD